MVSKSALFALAMATSPFSLVAASPDEDEALDIYEDGDDIGDYDDDYEDVAPYTIEYADLHTSVIFPDYPDKNLPLGENIKVLIGLDNRGSESLNVTGVGAFLHSPFDLNYFVQNFTGRMVSTVIPPNSQLSVEYTIRPDRSLEPLDFWLSGVVDFYGLEEQRMHRNTFLNETIELIEKPLGFTAVTVSVKLITYAFFGMLAYIAYFSFFKEKLEKTSGKAAKAAAAKMKSKGIEDSGAQSPVDDSAWTEQVYTQASSSRARPRNKNRKGNRSPRSPKSE